MDGCSDYDLALALELQDGFDRELVNKHNDDPLIDANSPTYYARHQPILTTKKPTSLADPEWELLDPTPNIQALFVQFNAEYFHEQLTAVEVRWSPRMTSCAGLCVYEGQGGLCSIRLSTPLLKLRPRKDLVETLLHEMIHAYLFVTNNNKDHNDHGPEFHKHMKRINSVACVNISVYHNFHDEVSHYQQHWWRCDGVCQKRPPYFGYVKRSMNRAPSSNDTWWQEHQTNCGGNFIKIKEPKGYSQKKSAKDKKVSETKPSGDVEMLEGFVNKTKRTNNSSDSKETAFHGTGFTLGQTSSSSSPSSYVTTGASNGRGVPAHSILLATLERQRQSKTSTVVPSAMTESSCKTKVSSAAGDLSSTVTGVSAQLVTSNNNNDEIILETHTDKERGKKRTHRSKSSKEKMRILHDILEEDDSDDELQVAVKSYHEASEPLQECPVCYKKIEQKIINTHLDDCLTR